METNKKTPVKRKAKPKTVVRRPSNKFVYPTKDKPAETPEIKKKKEIWAIYGATGGRPAKYTTPEALSKRLYQYFEFLAEYEEKPTITGLCLFCGFESRQSFYDYGNKAGFSYIVNMARALIEHHYEQLMQTGTSNAGAIFALKNMGWKDKTEVDNNIIETKQVFKIGDQTITFD